MVLNAFDLTGKVAIVTGCDTGLGQGMTLGLAQAGCDIVGINRKIPHDTAAQVLALGRRFHAIQADLSQENDMSGLVDQAVAAMGRVDILVNNAGIIRRHDALTFTESDWDAVIDLNLKEGSGWVIDKNASTKERTILYYTGILPAGKSTPALSDTLTIDGSIATKVKQDVTEKDGYKTITTTYAYDGYNFQLEAEADAVQTHNAQDAIKSAWGVDVDVDGNGNISLR